MNECVCANERRKMDEGMLDEPSHYNTCIG